VARAGTKLKTRRATIRDVALAAGVSPMTVSNVLNGKHQYVGSQTRKVVEREIARLNYRLAQSARGLRVSQRKAVGLIFVDDSPAFLTDHFNSQMAAGLSNVLHRADYTLTVQGVRPGDIGKSVMVRTVTVDGFCVALSGSATERREAVRTLARLEQPIVLLQETAHAIKGDLYIARQDDFGGGRLIADHLVARGARRFVIVAPTQEWPAISERIAGFREAIAEAGAKASIEILKTRNEELDSVHEAVVQYLDRKPLPDAFVGGNDRLAIGTMSTLLGRGARIPAEVRVTGFNGFEARRYALPLVTTVMSPAYQLGEKAGEALLRRLSAGRFEQAETILPVHFEPGQTT
jgi:DNA-binding LacI/PurR family transcriptional regulator